MFAAWLCKGRSGGFIEDRRMQQGVFGLPLDGRSGSTPRDAVGTLAVGPWSS